MPWGYQELLNLQCLPHVQLFSRLSDECATSPLLSGSPISILLPLSCFCKDLCSWGHPDCFSPPSVVLLLLQLWPPVWTGVQFQSAITLDTKTKGSRGSAGPGKLLSTPPLCTKALQYYKIHHWCAISFVSNTLQINPWHLAVQLIATHTSPLIVQRSEASSALVHKDPAALGL